MDVNYQITKICSAFFTIWEVLTFSGLNCDCCSNDNCFLHIYMYSSKVLMFQKKVLPPSSGWLKCFRWTNQSSHPAWRQNKPPKHLITTCCMNPKHDHDWKLLVSCAKCNMHTETIKIPAVSTSNIWNWSETFINS